MQNLWTATVISHSRAVKDLARSTAVVKYVHTVNGTEETVTYTDIGHRKELYQKMADRLGQLNALDEMIAATPVGEVRDLTSPIVSADIEAAKPENAELNAWRASVGKLNAMQALVKVKGLAPDHPDLVAQEQETQALFRKEFLNG